MGNCMDNNQNHQPAGQVGTIQPVERQTQQNEHDSQNEQGGSQYFSQNGRLPVSQQPFSQAAQPPTRVSYQSPKKDIDFDTIGRNFLFYDEQKKLNNDRPWQRDESNNSNRPNQLMFGLSKQSQALPSGLNSFDNQVLNLNTSMNRTSERGYATSVLQSDRKKQNIFYDSSTYNQNPYVKTSKAISFNNHTTHQELNKSQNIAQQLILPTNQTLVTSSYY